MTQDNIGLILVLLVLSTGIYLMNQVFAFYLERRGKPGDGGDGRLYIEVNGVEVWRGPEIQTLKVTGRIDDIKTTVCVQGDVRSLVTDGHATCDSVTGDIDAGGDVTCDVVGGSVSAGGDVRCSRVTGDVRSGGALFCYSIRGNAIVSGDVSCQKLDGRVVNPSPKA